LTLREELVAEYISKKAATIEHPSPTVFRGYSQEHLTMAKTMTPRELAGLFLVIHESKALTEMKSLPRAVRKGPMKATYNEVERLLGLALGS